MFESNSTQMKSKIKTQKKKGFTSTFNVNPGHIPAEKIADANPMALRIVMLRINKCSEVSTISPHFDIYKKVPGESEK